MLHATVKDVLEDTLDPGWDPYCIYLVRDEVVVLYVGRSTDPVNRLRMHFGLTSWGGGSSLASFYQKHRDEAISWYIELYTLEECESYVLEYLQKSVSYYRDPRFDRMHVREAELACIQHFRPCLNEQNNLQPSPIPAKYLAQEDMSQCVVCQHLCPNLTGYGSMIC